MNTKLTALTILLSCGVGAAFAAADAPATSMSNGATTSAATTSASDAVPVAGQAKTVTVRVDTSQLVIAPPAGIGAVAQADAGAAAAHTAAKAKGSDDDATLQALLGATSPEYNKMVKCIATRHVEDTEVLSSRLIVFRDAKHIWINQLAARCPGLTQEAKVAYQGERAYRYCAFDGVHVLNYFGTPATDVIDSMGPGCFLGKFEPISKTQLAVLREHYVPSKPSLVQQINDRESKKKKL